MVIGKYMDQTYWRLVWEDDFSDATLDSNHWNRQVEEAGRFNEEWQRYTDSVENAYIDNGVLVIKAIHESSKHGKDHYTSARLNTAGKRDWCYGKIAARMKLPFGMGMWPAFWMLGSNIDENGGDTPWPMSGEIDIMEMYGSFDDSNVEANLHHADLKGEHTQMGGKSFQLPAAKFCEDFHVFEIEWDDTSITWFVDGVEYAKQSIVGPEYAAFHKPHFILINLAVGGKFSGRPDNTTQFPQVLLVDWVRVYQKA